jgi:RNA polymerase sigma-70 factor (ECF subfamily)
MQDDAPSGCVSASDGVSTDERRQRLVALVHEHHRELYQYAYRLTGSGWDAEDLTQQTFLAAQRKIDQIRDADRSRAWLFTTLRRCYSKSHRRRRPTPEASLDFAIDTVAAEPRGDAFDTSDFDRESLQHAVDELPAVFKLVLLMYYFEECSYRDIASSLRVPIGTVMSRLARAKRHIKTRLLATFEMAPGR